MISPSFVDIEYRLAGEGDIRLYHMRLADGRATANCPSFNAEAVLDGAEFHVTIEPTCELTVVDCTVFTPIDLRKYSKALFNGYQSWTDTQELPLDARMPGLSKLSRRIVDHWVLDGSGDYRFTEYSNAPGRLHGWTYAYLLTCENAASAVEDAAAIGAAPTPATDAATSAGVATSADAATNAPAVNSTCQLVASLDESLGLTKLELLPAANALIVRTEAPCEALEAGKSYLLTDLAFIEEAQVDDAFAAWFDLQDSACRDNAPLTGYSSWYRHYGDIDETRISQDLESMAEVFDQLNTAGFQRVFQIDDGWAPVGDWLLPNTAKFPSGMGDLAQQIRNKGFIPGLWLAPFVCEHNSLLFASRADWLLRDSNGNPVRTGSHWTGGYALDTLNPGVRDYVKQCIKQAVNWGYGMLKLDFLHAACMLPHGGMNRGELMADALQLLREAAGDDVIIDGCGVPLGPAFGIMDFCRVGCDVGLEWDANRVIKQTEREHVSTRNSLVNTLFRAPLNGRAFGNDPDVILLNPTVKLSEEQRQMLLDAAACNASMLLTSDDVRLWTSADTARFQGALDLMRAARVNRVMNTQRMAQHAARGAHAK